MATPAEPVTSAIFRAQRSVDVDPDLAYEAAEESCRQAGENVIAALGAKIDFQVAALGAKIDSQVAGLDAKIDALSTRTDAQVAEIKAQITEVKAEIKAQGSLIENLRQVVWRVIWPLIALLAVPIFGLLYEALAR
ncbi:MAG: hypothetical protein OXL36_19220 [Bryobacterales bacterium]|nr:hypothetical protein [Bryobacterales bacterium]MDE0296539.1 hypothetical protein [Bryobacterales bacterium]